jgi:hypothetical protein
VPKPWVIRVLAVWCRATVERKVEIVKQSPNTESRDDDQGETAMLLSPTDVNTRSLEHHLRIDKVNRNGWLSPSPQHPSRANALATILRSLTGRRSSLGLGERAHNVGARSIA